MGSTKDTNGIFQIIRRLHVLIQWGTGEFKAWFHDNVMEYLKVRAAR